MGKRKHRSRPRHVSWDADTVFGPRPPSARKQRKQRAAARDELRTKFFGIGASTDQYRLMRYLRMLRERGQKTLAFLHAHRGSAEFSGRDTPPPLPIPVEALIELPGFLRNYQVVHRDALEYDLQSPECLWWTVGILFFRVGCLMRVVILRYYQWQLTLETPTTDSLSQNIVQRLHQYTHGTLGQFPFLYQKRLSCLRQEARLHALTQRQTYLLLRGVEKYWQETAYPAQLGNFLDLLEYRVAELCWCKHNCFVMDLKSRRERVLTQDQMRRIRASLVKYGAAAIDLSKFNADDANETGGGGGGVGGGGGGASEGAVMMQMDALNLEDDPHFPFKVNFRFLHEMAALMLSMSTPVLIMDHHYLAERTVYDWRTLAQMFLDKLLKDKEDAEAHAADATSKKQKKRKNKRKGGSVGAGASHSVVESRREAELQSIVIMVQLFHSIVLSAQGPSGPGDALSNAMDTPKDREAREREHQFFMKRVVPTVENKLRDQVRGYDTLEFRAQCWNTVCKVTLRLAEMARASFKRRRVTVAENIWWDYRLPMERDFFKIYLRKETGIHKWWDRALLGPVPQAVPIMSTFLKSIEQFVIDPRYLNSAVSLVYEFDVFSALQYLRDQKVVILSIMGDWMIKWQNRFFRCLSFEMALFWWMFLSERQDIAVVRDDFVREILQLKGL